MKKIDKVRTHLMENKSITSWQAINEYGITRLSAIIFTLRHKEGMNIVSYDIDFVDRFGDKGKFVKYVLEDNDKEI